MNLNLFGMFLAEGASDATGATAPGSMLTLLLPMALLALVFYFFVYRPQKKQEKETADMRNSIEIGDVIVTTGGIIAMVVKVKEDMLLVETSGNRTKIQIQKWAVHSVIERANEPAEKESSAKDSKRITEAKMKSKD